jgi:hypothetical protein
MYQIKLLSFAAAMSFATTFAGLTFAQTSWTHTTKTPQMVSVTVKYVDPNTGAPGTIHGHLQNITGQYQEGNESILITLVK